jgi:transcriptional regulator with XRE-family HTH domain
MTHNNKKIGDLIKSCRDQSGLTQQQVTEKLGSKNRSSYLKYETGETMPAVSKLESILNAMGFHLTLLVTPKKLTKDQIAAIDFVVKSDVKEKKA